MGWSLAIRLLIQDTLRSISGPPCNPAAKPEGRKIIAHGVSRVESRVSDTEPRNWGERLISAPEIAHIGCHASVREQPGGKSPARFFVEKTT